MARLAAGTAFLLIVTACSGDDASPTTTESPTTTVPTTTTIATTTTDPGPTSTLVYSDIEVVIEGDSDAQQAVTAFYGWIGDQSRPLPDIPEGLAEHVSTAQVDGSATLTGTLNWAAIGERGRAGLVTVDDDVVLVVDDGPGWRVVGASLPRFGLDPWFGDPLRYVLLIGTDARPGEDQQNYRADSLHILASNVAESSGGILGIPRDAYVSAPYGNDKYTNVNVYSGQQVMVDIARDLSDLPIEGYIITGFLYFQQLINDFGGVYVDVPFAMADTLADAFISRGYQLLWGDKALGFSRNRHLTGGDFTRSFHQGLVIAAGLQGVLERDITALPALIAMLDQYTWTDLSLEDLVTVAAGAFLLDPELVGNKVLPGTITSRGGASVVVLSPAAEDFYRDLDDGSLTPAG
jgi:LCP family protein required for cell wall assembly